MANHYIALVAGNLLEVVPATTSSGAATAGQVVALNPSGLVDPSMIPVTVPQSGSAIIDFGSTTPGTQQTSVVVTGVAGILTTSTVQACIMGDSTAQHNATEHMIVPITLACGAVVAGVGFTIFATSTWKLTGTFMVRWSWN